MKIRLNLLHVLYTIYAICTFFILMLFVIPFALMMLFLNNKAGGILIYGACRVWAALWYFLLGFKFKKHFLKEHDRKKTYIFVANHQSYLDIPQLMRSLHQPVRVLGKAEMAKIPLFGIIYRAAVVAVDRGSAGSKVASMRRLKRLLEQGISIFIFPEGGFNESGKPLARFYDGAFKMAIETQTPVKPILFVDTAARIPAQSLFKMTPGICRTIYLPEIDVTNFDLKQVSLLKEKVFIEMEKALMIYKK